MGSQFTKTLVLGIDGLSLTLARHLTESGVFQNLAAIIHDQHAMTVESELPEVSPVNWASFFTGRGPEEHGVYGFTGVDPGSYRLLLHDYTHVRAEPLWDLLGSKGMVSRIINLPCTYPAPELRGMLISGFVAHDLERAVYPKAILPMLRRTGYRLEADTTKGLNRQSALLEELRQTISSRRRAFDLFWPDLAWDFFVIVFTELDRLSHFLYEAMIDKSHVLHWGCMQILRDLDSAAGHILERFSGLPDPKRLLVVADHGFCRLEREVDINTFLRAEGFQTMKTRPENELDLGCLDSSSRAFALDPGRIYIHDQERFGRGNVARTEYASVRRKIMGALLQLEYRGRKVMERVLPGEEIYPHGVGLPPDLLCVPHKGFDLKAKFDREQVFGHYGRTGTHCREDVFFYDSHGTRPGKIRDLLSWIRDHGQDQISGSACARG